MAIVRLRPGELKRAIAENALSLQFQPQVHTPTGKLVGAEAFVRWPHPSYGMIGPGDIVALVEQGALHVEFDRWVVTAVCAQIKRWRSEGFDVAIVAANLWAQTLRSKEGVEAVSHIVKQSDAPVGSLEIECPRGTIGDPALKDAAKRLRKLGVRVASEEFADRAAAASAKEYDTLKIGYPIAREITLAGSTSAAAVSAIVDAARGSGGRVVADSVESPDQEDALLTLGCEIVQGYLYGPEVSAAELKQLAAVGAKRAAE
ncbi:MAG TPA: EAL domain-containing protein [Candidatus Limnocylindria bacterium]|nr:EAL domain-containing protein [Candidatus Limnocylindria bacterium]